MTKLSEVFGIGRRIPQYTYVDRSGLDTIFSYLLDTERHIVIHGASKQGKSCLRRKNLDESNCIVIQCKPEMSNNDVWQNVLRQLEVSMKRSINEVEKSGSSISGGVNVEGNALFVKAKGEINSEINSGDETKYEEAFLQGKENDLDFLARELKKKEKRLVIEDFHYLAEDERKCVAFDLKALYELEIYVIIIGIWSEQNLLTYYNGDLTGRIEEININWNKAELEEVIRKGEKTLNIEFDDNLKNEIIVSSFQNVGILQRLAEKVCFINSILDKQPVKQVITKDEKFNTAVEQVISDIGQRYTRICEVFVKGFRTDTKLRIYYKIFKVLTKTAVINLINGIPSHTLLKEVQELSEEDVRQADLTQCLDRIERLQASKKITPLLVSYNNTLRILTLMDREFLFYRRYSQVDWDKLVPD